MDIIEAEALMHGITAEREALKQEIAELTERRNALPRSDKKGAKEMGLRVMELTKRIKGLNLQHREARHRYEAKERHGLWETAVLTLWGQDGLTAARRQMTSERMQREGVVPQNPQSKSVVSQKDPILTNKPSPELRADLQKLHDLALEAAVEMSGPPPLTDSLLEKMVEAYTAYQSPSDRGYSQCEEGMRLALVAAGIYAADELVVDDSPVTCGRGCACLTDCGDYYESHGMPKPSPASSPTTKG